MDLKTGDPVRVSQNGSSVEARVLIRERMSRGRLLPRRGHGGQGNANALLNGGPVSVEITKVEA